MATESSSSNGIQDLNYAQERVDENHRGPNKSRTNFETQTNVTGPPLHGDLDPHKGGAPDRPANKDKPMFEFQVIISYNC
jgi:hypothetical protein